MNSPLSIDENATDLSTYAYSYPHKSSYRPLSPPVRIAEAWQDEDVRRLSLYIHVPFCEMRCGFCNLFTQSLPAADVVDAYLTTLVRQMKVVRAAVAEASFEQLALGGGTPTFLSAAQLARLFHQVETTFQQPIRSLRTSVEVSPATATPDRLRLLADFGVQRISIGVQSFIASEVQHIGRPQRAAYVEQALEDIRACEFPVLNIDLIYGDPLQTRDSWIQSLLAALRFFPEELYLYPLYVRPETGLARTGWQSFEHRTELYLAARDLLHDRGYVQASLRCFRLPRDATPASFGCQRDGMIGFGCGARSYTQRLHYSTRFATSQAGIRAILGEWIAQTDDNLALATHGIWLSKEEQYRRFVILSLLQAAGLAIAEFQERFPESSLEDIPEIAGLVARGWAARIGDRYVLTSSGLQHSDIVGPLLYSPQVRNRLQEFVDLATGAAVKMP
jgi:oxygen-independent coproporphyrinogen-3 oxidase